MIRRLVALWLAATILAFVPGAARAEPSPECSAYIIAVDGMSFLNSLPGMPDMEDNIGYVETALESMGLGLDAACIVNFDWSRDSEKTDEAVAELRTFLRAYYEAAQSEGKKLILVGHSWGTFLAHMALTFESNAAEPIRVDLVISLGSPLGSANAHQGELYPEEAVVTFYVINWLNRLNYLDCAGCFPLAERYVNYWVWGDAVSGPIVNLAPGVENVQMGQTGATRLTRNAATTAVWHIYDSLISSSVQDNSDIRAAAKEEIEAALEN